MDEVAWWLYALLLFFIALGGYFAAAEISLASVSQSRIKIRSDKGDGRATKTLYLLQHFDETLSTILIGNNIAHISAASVAALLVTNIWGKGALIYSTIVVTIVIFLIAEMLPKTLGKAYCESTSLMAAPLLYFLTKIFKPVSMVLTSLGNWLSTIFDDENQATVTEEEFYNIIESIKNEDAMEDQKGRWVHTALNFGDKTVDNILTVRTDIVAVDITEDPDENFEMIKSTKHSRVPVYRDSIDDVIGILQIRKYLKASYKKGAPADIEEFLDEPFFLFSSSYIDDALPAMSRAKVNMAIVTNSFGGVVGLVTVEDILEELVGEIWDEDDVAVEYFRDLGQGYFEVDASVNVGEVYEKLDLDDRELDDQSHESMGNWVYESLARIPDEGEKFRLMDLDIEITKMENRRIMKLRVCAAKDGEEEVWEK
ncbi:MAG: HlyC/CorC family transporter [Tissierellia bacterium]|nr:HlyC/CorC family transporter [Tissierellia bacterium]